MLEEFTKDKKNFIVLLKKYSYGIKTIVQVYIPNRLEMG
jgi:hypothetical protein